MVTKIAAAFSSLIWGTFFCMNNFYPQPGSTTHLKVMRNPYTGEIIQASLVTSVERPVLLVPVEDYNKQILLRDLTALVSQPFPIIEEHNKVSALLANHPIQNLAAIANYQAITPGFSIIEHAVYNQHIAIANLLLGEPKSLYAHSVITQRDGNGGTLINLALQGLVITLRNPALAYKIAPMCTFIKEYLTLYLDTVRDTLNLDAFFYQHLVGNQYVRNRLGRYFGCPSDAQITPPQDQPSQVEEMTQHLEQLRLTPNVPSSINQEATRTDEEEQKESSEQATIQEVSETKQSESKESTTHSTIMTNDEHQSLVAQEHTASIEDTAEQKSEEEKNENDSADAINKASPAITPSNLLKNILKIKSPKAKNQQTPEQENARLSSHKQTQAATSHNSPQLPSSSPAPLVAPSKKINAKVQPEIAHREQKNKPVSTQKGQNSKPAQIKKNTDNHNTPPQSNNQSATKPTQTPSQKSNTPQQKTPQEEAKVEQRKQAPTQPQKPQHQTPPAAKKNSNPKAKATQQECGGEKQKGLATTPTTLTTNTASSTTVQPTASPAQPSNPAAPLVDQIITLLRENPNQLKEFLSKNRKAIKAITAWKKPSPRAIAIELGQIDNACWLDGVMKNQAPTPQEITHLLAWAQQRKIQDHDPAFIKAQKLCADWYANASLNNDQFSRCAAVGLTQERHHNEQQHTKGSKTKIQDIQNAFTYDCVETLKKIQYKHYNFSLSSQLTFDNNEEKYSYYGALLRALLNEPTPAENIIKYLIDTMTREGIDLHHPIPARINGIDDKHLIDIALNTKNDEVIDLFMRDVFRQNSGALWSKIINAFRTNAATYRYTWALEQFIAFNAANSINTDKALLDLSADLAPDNFAFLIFYSLWGTKRILTLLEEGKMPINYFDNDAALIEAQALTVAFQSNDNNAFFCYLLKTVNPSTWIRIVGEDRYLNALECCIDLGQSATESPSRPIVTGLPSPTDETYTEYLILTNAMINGNQLQALRQIDKMVKNRIPLYFPIEASIREIAISSLIQLAEHCNLGSVANKIAVQSLATIFRTQDFEELLRLCKALMPQESGSSSDIKLTHFLQVPNLLETLTPRMEHALFFEICNAQDGGYTVLTAMIEKKLFPISFFTQEMIEILLQTKPASYVDLASYQNLLSLIVDQEYIDDEIKQKIHQKVLYCINQQSERTSNFQTSLHNIQNKESFQQELRLLVDKHFRTRNFDVLKILWDFYFKTTRETISIDFTALRIFSSYAGLMEIYAKIIDPNVFIRVVGLYGTHSGKAILAELINTQQLDVSRCNEESIATLRDLEILQHDNTETQSSIIT